MTEARSHLLVAAGVVHDGDDGARMRAVRVEGDRITWVGVDPRDAPAADRVLDLGSAWLTAAFVDAHVHGTATGLSLSGLDLAAARSLDDALGRLRAFAQSTDAAVILGHGWDDFAWPEQRPMTAAEVSEAAPGRRVLLARVDVHSCVVDSATLRQLPLERLEGVEWDADGRATGWVREDASEAARALVYEDLPPRQLAEARRAACHRAASLGIATLHEMAHPGLSGWDDAVAWQQGDWPVEVLTWWAELDPTLRCRDHGMRPGGDLFLDGSIGSRTAAVATPYCDHGGGGALFHSDDDVAAFFTAATEVGVGAGVHAIGDRAVDQAVRAIEAAAGAHGAERVRRCRHRIEHVELVDRDHVTRMATLGVVASVQPMFDARWGGRDQMYARRFGAETAARTNPFSWFAAAGVPLAFGSDSTVTPLDPWGAITAAEHHRGGLGLDRRVALDAHTVGGRFVAFQDDVGRIAPGFRADVAVWDADPLVAEDLSSLSCLATLVRGRVAHGVL